MRAPNRESGSLQNGIVRINCQAIDAESMAAGGSVVKFAYYIFGKAGLDTASRQVGRKQAVEVRPRSKENTAPLSCLGKQLRLSASGMRPSQE